MSTAKYEALGRDSDNALNSEIVWTGKDYSKSKQQLHWIVLAIFLLVISLVFNVIAYLPSEKLQCSTARGFTISHEANIPLIKPHDERSLYDPVWDDLRYDYNEGVIAVDNDFVEKHNLPQAQRWPWDESKSVYMLQGWHSIHCIMMLRNSLIASDKNESLPYPISHLTHCLHSIREDVVCAADDTPLYTGALNAQAGLPVAYGGVGQVRMCRDWDAVRQYALEHSACYDERASGLRVPEAEKYKFCPNGSKPWL